MVRIVPRIVENGSVERMIIVFDDKVVKQADEDKVINNLVTKFDVSNVVCVEFTRLLSPLTESKF